jgi:hypothetical protein
MTDQPKAAAEPIIIAAGQIVVMNARWTGKDAQGFVGIFKATRDFDPAAEYQEYARQFPSAGLPTTWDATGRAAFAIWAMQFAGFIEPADPYYLFLEPWPEKPEAPSASPVTVQ